MTLVLRAAAARRKPVILPKRRRIGMCLTICLLAPMCLAFAVGQPRSISASRQFVVYGDDVRLRGVVCDVAETTKQHLLGLLAQRDEWKLPIVINAQSPQANVPELPSALLQIAQTGAGLKVQLDLLVGRAVSAAEIQRQLGRAILLELMYRDHGDLASGAQYIEAPEWLIEGLLALAPGRDRSYLSATLAAASPTEEGLAEFLNKRAELLDPLSRELYRACSAALVQTLIGSADGRKHLREFIRDVPAGALDALADLRVHFPELAQAHGGLERSWRETIAAMIGADSFRPLSVAATQEQLRRLLVCEVPKTRAGSIHVPLHDFAAILRDGTGRAALTQVAQSLLLFEPRANPVYREIVIEYHELAMLLSRGKTYRVRERLARVEQWQAQLAQRMSRIDNYLNWFEATQSNTSSGLFAQVPGGSEGTERPAQRRDRISVYLDAVEAQTAEPQR